MKSKNKKGFTLIELIAVLVILAIIALIVTPLVLNVIRKAKDSANKRSVDAYGRSVELALAKYVLDNGDTPNDLNELTVEYTGNKVECNIKKITENGSIYLTECTVNGVKVKDKSTEDGWYHYGKRDLTNEEYVDMYGVSLEKAISEYKKSKNQLPEDYKTLKLDYKGKDINCDVTVNSDGTVYLTKCSVAKTEVKDSNNEDGYYHYGAIVIPPTATETLLSKANDASITTYTDGNTHEMYTFSHDATTQTEALTDYRYIGSDPYNYVTFNNELWRIIGVFTVEDANGNKEQRIKIIRNESIGNKAWDSNRVNEWSTASLQTYLNGDYYNSLSEEAKAMIGDTKYYLGGRTYDSTTHFGTASDIYSWERGTTVYSGRSTNWIGKIGLMYPSDYAYTYAGGVDNKCYTDTHNCRTSNTDSIPSSGWLYKKQWDWLISPGSGNSASAFFVGSTGYVSDNGYVTGTGGARPSTYLISSIHLDKGTGTQDNPYTLKQA